MTTVLVTNDDGYNSAGYLPLIKELSKEYTIVPVVPDRGKSWISKSLTMKKKLKVKTMIRDNFELFLLNATPADCVQIGLYHLAENYPDLVVSGINIGLNIGNARMLSSGTVGAAMEAALVGVKAIASSIQIPLAMRKKIDFYHPDGYSCFLEAAKITTKIAHIVLEHTFPDTVDLFSVNIPFDATEDSEIAVTVPFQTSYGQLFHRIGNRFVHRTPPIEFTGMDDQTDLKALYEQKISLTPVSLALGCPSSVPTIEEIIHKEW
ncbi:MAG: 5'/3'-nucleotidase SurE [Methanobacteriota archaeon]